jgi:hypothetical protein
MSLQNNGPIFLATSVCVRYFNLYQKENQYKKTSKHNEMNDFEWNINGYKTQTILFIVFLV